MKSDARFRASYYNLRVSDPPRTLLFNGVTGALLKLDRKLARALAPWLGADRARTAGTGYAAWQAPEFRVAELPASVRDRFPALLDAGVFVPRDADEREGLRHAYEENRSIAPFFVTVTTTLDCNMRCYYCYQKEGELEKMSPAMADAIAGWIEREIAERGHRSAHLDWYGGEPMLNQEVIERISARIIPFCAAHGVAYKGSMICNGTNWPHDKVAFVTRNHLDSIQFSLDGPERHQNKRRSMAGADGRKPSFDEVMETIGALVGHTRIYLRINVDPWIGWSALEVLDECEKRGWLEPDTQFYPYLAIINAMTEHCGFIGKVARFEEFHTEFAEIEQAFYARLGTFRDEKSFEMVQYFPNRIHLNCAAVSNNSMVFGPNGRMYKCGLDVGDHHRAHATIGTDGAVAPAAAAAAEGPAPLAADRWDRFDPFTHSRCSECQYLPVCMGGCPKAQIEKDATQVRYQSEFWQNNFDRIIREYYVASGR
jgi:uncharacterized protein